MRPKTDLWSWNPLKGWRNLPAANVKWTQIYPIWSLISLLGIQNNFFQIVTQYTFRFKLFWRYFYDKFETHWRGKNKESKPGRGQNLRNFWGWNRQKIKKFEEWLNKRFLINKTLMYWELFHYWGVHYSERCLYTIE